VDGTSVVLTRTGGSWLLTHSRPGDVNSKYDIISIIVQLYKSKLHTGIYQRIYQSDRAYHLPVGSSCLPLSAQYGAALPHRPAPTGKQRWLPAASTLVVVGYVLRTEHVTIGGRAFSSTAAHAWNSLPTAVEFSESLDIFRRRLKTELFERSYNWQTTLLLRDLLSLSSSFLLWLQPWSLSTIMLLWHSFLIIIIIKNNLHIGNFICTSYAYRLWH